MWGLLKFFSTEALNCNFLGCVYGFIRNSLTIDTMVHYHASNNQELINSYDYDYMTGLSDFDIVDKFLHVDPTSVVISGRWDHALVSDSQHTFILLDYAFRHLFIFF